MKRYLIIVEQTDMGGFPRTHRIYPGGHPRPGSKSWLHSPYTSGKLPPRQLTSSPLDILQEYVHNSCRMATRISTR